MKLSVTDRFVLVTYVALGLSVASNPVQAQDAPPEPSSQSDADNPWNKGVSIAQRNEAQAIFEKGNYHFERSGYSKALGEYRKAIALWDHPAVRYNIAICLMQLDEPIEAIVHLDKSLSYGEEPLGKRLFSEGKLHQKNLAARLSTVKVSTKHSGARVTLDGEELLTGPGSEEHLVLAKKHQIVASKKGMLTLTKDFVPPAGEVTSIDIKLVPLDGNVVLVRPWASWKPWAVVGGGLVASAIGGTFYLLASNNVDAYDQGIAASCPAGCPAGDPAVLDLQTKKDRGELQNKVMVGSFVAGGLAVSTGLVLAFLNRPRVKRASGAETTPKSAPKVTVSPIAGGGSRGALTGLSWQF